MNIILITQNEFFCLHQSLSYIYKILPEISKISGIKLFTASLSGLKLTPFQKTVSKLKVIGLKFTFYNAMNLIALTMSGASVYNFPRENSNSNLSMLEKSFFRGIAK